MRREISIKVAGAIQSHGETRYQVAVSFDKQTAKETGVGGMRRAVRQGEVWTLPVTPDPISPHDEILSVAQAAQLLQFQPYTIREKARSGEIPGQKVGREWRFSLKALLGLVGGESG